MAAECDLCFEDISEMKNIPCTNPVCSGAHMVCTRCFDVCNMRSTCCFCRRPLPRSLPTPEKKPESLPEFDVSKESPKSKPESFQKFDTYYYNYNIICDYNVKYKYMKYDYNIYY